MGHSTVFAGQPLLSAELHYFRVPRDDWELLLARMRQLGANTIATAVPWAWHEPTPGALDLAGASHPQRDLAGFVWLCARLGLRVLLKPGPLAGDDLLGGGIPPWLLRDRPDLQALRFDGQPWLDPSSGAAHPSCLQPDYLAAARAWITAFSAAARPLQAPDGPVIALRAGGALAADSNFDPRRGIDYNQHVVTTLWPQWRASRRPPVAGRPQSDLRSWQSPQSLADLQHHLELGEFANWLATTAAATVAGWLRDDGWQVPIYYELPATAWDTADLPGLARATGWLGQGDAGDAPATFDVDGERWFERYVRDAHWRPRLARHLSPGQPSFCAATSAAQDFWLAAPLAGGLQALNVAMGVQTQSDNPAISALSRWALDAPVRPDGSARPQLWNAKIPYMLLGAAGTDVAATRSPADLALGYSRLPERLRAWGAAQHDGEPADATLAELRAESCSGLRAQTLAQRLVRAGVDFDLLDLDATAPDDLARYALVVAPAAAALARATQAKLAGCANLALVGDTPVRLDEHLEPCTLLDDTSPGDIDHRQGDQETRSNHDQGPISLSPGLHGSQPPLRLSKDVTGEHLADLVVDQDAAARYAWADGEDVDVSIRYGQEHSYIVAANRRPGAYSGTLTYRERDGSIQHLHIGVGGLRVAMVMLKDDEVVGAAIGGDGADGGWLARGMHTSVVFNNGAGVVAPCGAGLLFSAPQSGRFQVRRPAGWEGMIARRLLLSGILLPAAFQTDQAHLVLPYTAEDEQGQTDLYMLLPAGEPLSGALRDQCQTLLQARAAALLRAAALAADGAPQATGTHHDALVQAAPAFQQAARELEQLAARDCLPDEYAEIWAATGERCRQSISDLEQALAALRHQRLAGADRAAETLLETSIARVLGIVVRASLAYDRE